MLAAGDIDKHVKKHTKEEPLSFGHCDPSYLAKISYAIIISRINSNASDFIQTAKNFAQFCSRTFLRHLLTSHYI